MISECTALSDKNWFSTGGTARWYATPTSFEEFRMVLTHARSHEQPVALIGEGANILMNDTGFAGLIIKPSIAHLHHESHSNYALVTAGAGVSFAHLITYCLEHQFVGLEEFSGIPGSVGGSVYINIHYFRHLLSDFLVSATVIHAVTGEITVVDTAWFEFGYNQSKLQSGRYYLLDATFRVTIVNQYEAAYARGRSQEIIRHRQQRYPKERTCGSFFRNFYEHEVTVVSNNKKMIYVAYYLDKLGIKGELTVGKASVAYQHANMIVTREGATSADVIELARTMQQLVYNNFGILPQSECQFIGFEKHPLLTLGNMAVGAIL